MSHTVATKSNFQSEVLDYKGKVLVDFWASWCGPCLMLGPIIEEIGDEMGDKVKVVKVNVDEENELAAQYNISSIPSVFIFVDGEVKENIVGFRQKQEYLQALNKY
jgi:thioredoxin 1